MTLALLIMAVSGAWAADKYTITFAANGNTKTVENVTLPKTFQCSWENADGELDLILKELYGWSWSGNSNQTFCDPNNIPESSDKNKVVAGNDNGNHYITINNVFEGTATITGTFVVNNNADKPYSLDISIVAIPPTEWDLTSQDGKNWILDKMPANDIELQVEYYAESNLFLSKNALADKANIAVTAGELGVQFGNDGKSANTITEGTEMTVKYNGTKKVIGFKVEKKAAEPVADIIWDITNVTDLDVPGTESYTKEGVTLRANAHMIHANWYNFGDPLVDGIGFNANEPGGFTFTAPTGKAFTKIEMTLTGSGDWETAYGYGKLGTGWAFNADMVKEILTVTWTGNAASTVDLLKDTDDFSGANVKSIAFYLSE